MATFADYLDLRVAVSEETDARDITDVMPRFVQAAENNLNNILRCREMITTGATLTFTSSLAPLPSDFLEVVTIWDAGGNFALEGSVKQVLQPSRDIYAFSIVGTSVYIYGADNSATRLMDYFAALPTLTTSPTTSNWLLQAAPNLYLFAVCCEVAKWQKNGDALKAYQAQLDGEIAGQQYMDARARWGSSSIRMRSATP